MSKKQSTATRSARAERAAERAAVMRRQQQARDRRRNSLIVAAVVVLVLAAIGGIALAVQSGRDTTGRAGATPTGVVDDYAIPRGPASAPVTVDVYEDFLCPFCGQFEAETRDWLARRAEAGDVQVHYHVVSILTDYSTRAANAAAVVLDTTGRDAAVRFHDLLYKHQPPESSDGLSDEQLIDLAVEAGASRSAVAGPIESLAFEQWVRNATEAFSRKGFTGTPTVLVDGRPIRGGTIDELVTHTKTAVQQGLRG
jgi:protein-disulfide isomerase